MFNYMNWDKLNNNFQYLGYKVNGVRIFANCQYLAWLKGK